MLEPLAPGAAARDIVRPVRTRRLRLTRRAGSWLLLSGWIVLPLMPVLALGLSKLLGIEF